MKGRDEEECGCHENVLNTHVIVIGCEERVTRVGSLHERTFRSRDGRSRYRKSRRERAHLCMSGAWCLCVCRVHLVQFVVNVGQDDS